MRVTIFGGSFNPPHCGHRLIVSQVARLAQIDRLWLVPCFLHTFAKPLETPAHRLNMTSLLIDSLPPSIKAKVRLDSIEIASRHSGSTFETLSTLQSRYPQHSFSFLIGSDQLPRFHQWHRYQNLAQLFPSFVYPRPGYTFEPLYPRMQPLPHLKTSPLSSTRIRNRLSAGDDVSSDLPPQIASYITKHRLYP